ncbi:MAG: WGR domain-containing protein, partial [Nitrospinaceae bacterium]|nr:WGR domain-containing protein [Nitrospinaceae bacterium]
MAKRYFEYKDAKSKKFWEVSVSAKKVTIRYGKLGTDGQTSLKELSTPAEAKAHAEKQAAGKVKKGYKEAKVKAVKKVAKKAAKKKTIKKKTTKKVTKKKVVAKVVKTDTSTELKQHVSKIKKLLTQRDCTVIDSGIELARSLDNPAVFKELLKDCTIGKEGKLVTNKIFTGTGPAQPYLNYALLGMTAYAPKACAAVVTLRQSIIRLAMVLPSAAEPLAEFKNLKSLDLGGSGSIQNVDGLANCTKLT